METRFSKIESNGTCHLSFFHHVEEIWEPKNAPKKLIKNNLLKHAHHYPTSMLRFWKQQKTNFLISQYVVSKKFQTERKALVLVVLLTSQQVIHVSFTKA